MLAYLFWHRPTPATDPAGYEKRLATFHARLARDPPAGFLGSAAFRVTLPWTRAEYEDWYLVADWAELGVLNGAAVDAARRDPHDAVAQHAGDGAGGVYALRAGDLAVIHAGAASWSPKPRGVPYPDFELSVVQDRKPAEFALWQRQMVLGPAPEFCLLTRGDSMTRVTP